MNFNDFISDKNIINDWSTLGNKAVYSKGGGVAFHSVSYSCILTPMYFEWRFYWQVNDGCETHLWLGTSLKTPWRSVSEGTYKYPHPDEYSDMGPRCFLFTRLQYSPGTYVQHEASVLDMLAVCEVGSWRDPIKAESLSVKLIWEGNLHVLIWCHVCIIHLQQTERIHFSC